MEITSTERVLSLILPSLPSSIGGIGRYLRYKNNSIELDDEKYEKLMSQIPSFWHSKKDRIIHFTITADGVFFCEREKEIYNYSTKSVEKKIYVFDAGTKDDVKKLTDVLYKFFEEEYIQKIEDIQLKIINELRHLSYLRDHFLRLRSQFLANSDYKLMPDYPIQESEKNQWIEYRQQLRDITKQEAWVNRNYIDVKFPVAPDNKEQVEEIIFYLKSNGIDFTNYRTNEKNVEEKVSYFIENLAQLTAKKAIIETLVRIGLPSINKIIYPNYPEFSLDNFAKSSYEDVKIFSEFDNYKNEIEEELKKINNDLTIDKIYQMIKDSVSSIDIDKDIEDVLMDVENETLEE
jgi:hypothetical protein